MELTSYLRIQARANRLSNHRLHAAMAPLSRAEFHAPRVGFFPSLAQTLNHILEVDLYYIGALHREAGHRAAVLAFVPSRRPGGAEPTAGGQRRAADRAFATRSTRPGSTR